MHADETIGAIGCGRELGDRDRRGVSGEQRVGLQRRAELLQDLDLQLLVLGRGLDDEIAGGELRPVRGRGDTRQRGVAIGHGHLVLLDQTIQAAAHRGKTLGDGGVGDVDHHHAQSGRGAYLGDAVAHGSGPDDANGVRHNSCPFRILRVTCVFSSSLARRRDKIRQSPPLPERGDRRKQNRGCLRRDQNGNEFSGNRPSKFNPAAGPFR